MGILKQVFVTISVNEEEKSDQVSLLAYRCNSKPPRLYKIYIFLFQIMNQLPKNSLRTYNIIFYIDNIIFKGYLCNSSYS